MNVPVDLVLWLWVNGSVGPVTFQTTGRFPKSGAETAGFGHCRG